MEILNNIFGNFVVQILLGVAVMVFIIAIGEAISKGVAGRSRERSAEQKRVIQSLQKEIAALRQELEEMRSLTVNHSMSLDRNVEVLQQRVQRLEERATDRETLR
ncbi:MAG: hypothetical protein C4341_10035 [Armatimonadota bacterium]